MADTLLKRFGGELVVEDFIDKVYNAMAADPALKSFFGQSAGRAFNLQVLKDRTVDYLCSDAPGGWGTDPYHGPELFASHSALNITMKQYDVFMKCTKKILKEKGIASAIQKEVFKSFEDMREPIVDPKGELLQQLKDKLAAAEKAAHASGDNDYDPTGFGMSTSRETAAKWAAKDARDKELREKMAKLKADRAAKAQAEAKAKAKAKAKAEASPKAKAKPKVKPKSKPTSPTPKVKKSAVEQPEEKPDKTEPKQQEQPENVDDRLEEDQQAAEDKTDVAGEVSTAASNDAYKTDSEPEPQSKEEATAEQPVAIDAAQPVVCAAPVESRTSEPALAMPVPQADVARSKDDDILPVRQAEDVTVAASPRRCYCWGF